MNEIAELEWITNKKNRRIIADNVEVPFLGVESQRESSDVSFGISCSAFTRHRGKSEETIGLLPDPGKKLGSRESGNIVCHGQCAVGR
jgi:hypothetical protein